MFWTVNFSTFKFGSCLEIRVSAPNCWRADNVDSAACSSACRNLHRLRFLFEFSVFWRAFPVIRFASSSTVFCDWSKLTNLNAPVPIGCVFCCSTVPWAIIGTATNLKEVYFSNGRLKLKLTVFASGASIEMTAEFFVHWLFQKKNLFICALTFEKLIECVFYIGRSKVIAVMKFDIVLGE